MPDGPCHPQYARHHPEGPYRRCAKTVKLGPIAIEYDRPGPKARMRTLAQSNDLVRLSFLAALLRDAGIESVLLDAHVSAVEGSIGAIPRRLAVLEEDEVQARRVLREADLL